MKIFAKSDKWVNIRGGKKIKIISKNKPYIVLDKGVYHNGHSTLLIKQDNGQINFIQKSLFHSQTINRKNKLDQLGI
jgi:hypothetical protein